MSGVWWLWCVLDVHELFLDEVNIWKTFFHFKIRLKATLYTFLEILIRTWKILFNVLLMFLAYILTSHMGKVMLLIENIQRTRKIRKTKLTLELANIILNSHCRHPDKTLWHYKRNRIGFSIFHRIHGRFTRLPLWVICGADLQHFICQILISIGDTLKISSVGTWWKISEVVLQKDKQHLHNSKVHNALIL